MSNWTHSICTDCWTKHFPDREAFELKEAEIEVCCFCGLEHVGVIYIRFDPAELNCKHAPRLDNKIVHTAIRLADGFTWDEWLRAKRDVLYGDRRKFLAALVAQLVGQADKTEWKVHVYKGITIICNGKDEEYCIHKGDDRTKNTLRAIVDNRILEANHG